MKSLLSPRKPVRNKAVRRKKSDAWEPVPGILARYTGKSARQVGRGAVVKVIAEARAGRFVIEAMAQSGRKLLTTVRRGNLSAHHDLFTASTP
jgi:hypothetical protein